MSYGPQNFAKEADVDPTVMAGFEAWQALLVRWNARINLVARGGLSDFWQRHALDSWQLWAHIPKTTTQILDLGSGAGFPGLAMAIGCKAHGRGRVTLVESTGKKASFLRTVIRELDLPATVMSERVENLSPTAYDVITARAFAPLPRLLTYAAPFWGEDTVGLFLKGQGVEAEIDKARLDWVFKADVTESLSDPDGSVLQLSQLKQTIEIKG